MNPERWAKINELFDAAMELDSNVRDEFLQKQCADDRELRDQVEKLLSSQDSATDQGFLQPNALNLRDQLPSDKCEMIGQNLGPYQIKRRIGSGGMGNVYLAARKEDFQQRVAIKLLKRGMDTDEILKRFRREIRVLAALGAHPNIARLIDAGTTPDGLPYFVMEYVEGKEIDRYCDSQRLSITDRLALFQSVCSAVHFAHQHTVIHRDIKPSNILVSRDGLPKLIDFGIAKLTAPELGAETAVPTRTEFRAMTPEYASPEQVLGESITTSSDVYSLGVVLYQLLTGSRPYRIENRAPRSLQKAVRDSEVKRPSTAVKTTTKTIKDGKAVEISPEEVSRDRDMAPKALSNALRGDLDNMVMMALRKEPNSRYASAGQMAADIQRYLEGQPVVARPLSRRQRFWRVCRRNPVGIGLVSAIVAGCLFGMAYLSSLSRQLVRSSALEGAQQQAVMLYEGHKYYTQVLENINETAPAAAEKMKPPATFTIGLFEFLNKSDNNLGTTAQLRSEFPFASRANRIPLDDFQLAALRWFEAGNGDSYHRFESVRDRPALRYAIAMRMKQSCCDCHNTHPDSTKRDWQPGQVRGLLEVDRPLSNDKERMTSGLITALGLIGCVFGGVFAMAAIGLSLRRE